MTRWPALLIARGLSRPLLRGNAAKFTPPRVASRGSFLQIDCRSIDRRGSSSSLRLPNRTLSVFQGLKPLNGLRADQVAAAGGQIAQIERR